MIAVGFTSVLWHNLSVTLKKWFFVTCDVTDGGCMMQQVLVHNYCNSNVYFCVLGSVFRKFQSFAALTFNELEYCIKAHPSCP